MQFLCTGLVNQGPSVLCSATTKTTVVRHDNTMKTVIMRSGSQTEYSVFISQHGKELPVQHKRKFWKFRKLVYSVTFQWFLPSLHKTQGCYFKISQTCFYLRPSKITVHSHFAVDGVLQIWFQKCH